MDFIPIFLLQSVIMAMLNIEFQPIVANRNYAPERTFVTKWDVEIENNRAKKIARNRDRDTKYFEQFDEHSDSLPPAAVLSEYEDDAYSNGSDDESDDGEGEETRQKWLRAVEAENAYYDQKYGRRSNDDWYDMNEAELDTDQAWSGPRKRSIFSSEESDFKRVRA